MTVWAGKDLPWRGIRSPRSAQGYGLLVATLTIAVFMLSQAAPTAVASTSDCSNESLRSELASSALPDCRAYEMVTPSYKQGYPLFALGYSNNGEKIIFYTLANLVGTEGAGESAILGNLYVDERTPAGWILSPLNPPSTEFHSQQAVAVEAESGETLWQQSLLGSSSLDLYTKSASGSLSRVGPLDPPRGFDRVVASSIDFRHIVSEALVSSNDWPFDKTVEGTVGSIYEYSGTENPAPILIGVEGEKNSSQLIGLCGTEFGGGASASEYNAISSSGETIFFTVDPVGWFGCEAAAPRKSEIYARINGSLTSPEPATTVHISASKCSCGEESGKNFEGASENGQKVFFTSTQKLTSEADAVDGAASGDAAKESGCAAIPVGQGGCNLYEYDFAGGAGQRLRAVSEGGEVLGVSAIAENGQRVYYVSRNALHDAGTNEYGQAPQNEQPNLYVHVTTSNETHFIATLSARDELMWSRLFVQPTNLAGEGGRFLLFASSTPGLTPDDRTSQTQLFEYDAVSEELVRVTKGEDGYNEDGNGVAFGVEPSSIWLNKLTLGRGSDFKVRTNSVNLAADGKTVVFKTRGQLSARATSAQQNCTSIYEFHTNGALSAGTVNLLSDGRDVQLYKGVLCGPQFQKMDANGDNVLFFTADPLLSQDTDGVQEDTYDARVDGGIAPPSVAGLCGGSSCEDGIRQNSTPIAPESTNEHGEAGLQSLPTNSAKNSPRQKKAHKRKPHTRKRKSRRSGVRGVNGPRPRTEGKVG